MFSFIKTLPQLRFVHRQSFYVCRSYSSTFNKEWTYYEQNYTRSVIKKTNGCILFDPLNHMKYLVWPKEFNKENQTIFNLISTVTKVNKHDRSHLEYSHKLLAPINDECLANYKSWPIGERLFALDVWTCVPAVTKFPFFEAILRDLLKVFPELEHGPALQMMYYVARLKYQLQSDEKAMVITKLEKIINGLTLDETAIYCLALVKSGCQVDNVSLVKSLYNCLLINDLSQYDNISVTAILKAVRQFSTRHHIVELMDLQNKLVPFAKDANLMGLTHIIQLGAKQSVFNAQLIDVIIKRFLENLYDLRIKDVERALLTIATCNHKNDIKKQFCDKAQEYLLTSLDTKYPASLIRCISYLVLLGIADARLIDWALSPEVYTNADAFPLLLIDSYAMINLAKTYTKNKLPENVCAKLMCDLTDVGPKSEFVDEINGILKTNGIDCMLSRAIPHIASPDIFLIYNKKTHKTVSILKGNADGSILDAKTLHENNPHLEAVAILSCLPGQVVFKSNRYNGYFQLRLNQLEMLGFKTIVIKKTIWDTYKSPEAKRRYLTQELCRNDVFLLSKMVHFIFKTNRKKD